MFTPHVCIFWQLDFILLSCDLFATSVNTQQELRCYNKLTAEISLNQIHVAIPKGSQVIGFKLSVVIAKLLSPDEQFLNEYQHLAALLPGITIQLNVSLISLEFFQQKLSSSPRPTSVWFISTVAGMHLGFPLFREYLMSRARLWLAVRGKTLDES